MPQAVKKIAVAIFALSAAACVHTESEQRGVVPVDAKVTISPDGAGGYVFSYNAPFSDEKGNFDFSKPGALHNRIHLTFTIAAGSPQGIKFKSEGRDAIWIVEKEFVDQATGSPAGPYRGKEFLGFTVSPDGRQLSLTNENDDGILYRYGLRFDLDGKTVIDDPDMGNGGGNDD